MFIQPDKPTVKWKLGSFRGQLGCFETQPAYEDP